MINRLYTLIKNFFGDRVPKYIVDWQIYNKPVNLKDNSNILFIEASNDFDGWGLGDGIFRIPTIEALSNTINKPVDILTTKKRALIFQNNPNIKNVLTLQKKWLFNICEIRKNKYSHIFMFNPSRRMFFIMILTGNFQTIRKIGLIGSKKRAKENHIDMYIDCLKNIVQNLTVHNNIPRIYWKIKKTLPEGFFYIGINLGAVSSLKNFKNWVDVFKKIKKSIPKNVKFVLVGNNEVQNINVQIVKLLGDFVMDYTENLSLSDTYNIISQCNGFIGTDGGNVNAALAIIQKNVFPIYSIIPGKNILPSNFPKVNIIQGICPIYKNGCYESAHIKNINGMNCEVTGQFEFNHLDIPPCLSCLVLLKEIVSKIEYLFIQAKKDKEISK